MRVPFTIGVLFSLLFQLPGFGTDEALSIEEPFQEYVEVEDESLPLADISSLDEKELAYCLPTGAYVNSALCQTYPANEPPYYYWFRNRLLVGANYTHVNIKPGDLSSFDGNLGGFQVAYEHRSLCGFYGSAKVSWRSGSTSGAAGKRSLLYFDAHEKVGYRFSPPRCDKDWALTLFTGFGYRYLAQTLTPLASPPLKFSYNEFYVPLGIATDYALNACYSLGCSFTWMPQVLPTVKIVPLNGARWILKEKLSNYLVEFPCSFRSSKYQWLSLSVNPYYERWHDGPSTATNSLGTPLGLPGNAYNFFGINFNVMCSF